MPKKIGDLARASILFFIPDLGTLHTLESHSSPSAWPPWAAEKPSRTTGYPAIERCCHRWPAAQLQRASCQQGRAGPQEEMFLSSSNLFSAIKEGPDSHCYSGSAYAAFFSWSKIPANPSHKKCWKRSRPATGLRTAGSPSFKAEKRFSPTVLLLGITVSAFYSSLKSSQGCPKTDNTRSSYLCLEIPEVGNSFASFLILQSAIKTLRRARSLLISCGFLP